MYIICVDEGLKKVNDLQEQWLEMYVYDGGFTSDYMNKNGSLGPEIIYGEFDYFDYRRNL